METLTIPKILSTLKERNEIATKKGYDNFSHMVLWNDKFFIREACNAHYFLNFLQDEFDLINQADNKLPFEEFSLPLEEVIEHCFYQIGEIFDFNIEKIDNLYLVKDVNNHIEAAEGDELLGYFTLNLFHCDLGEWFSIEDPIDGETIELANGKSSILGYTTGSINMSLVDGQNLSSREIIKFWREMGHCIQHMTTDLSSLPKHLHELGAMFLEYNCIEFYEITLDRTAELKKDIAIAMVDLILHSDKMNTEQDVIAVIEAVQDFAGINLSIDDLKPIIQGDFACCYFAYPYCRSKVREEPLMVFKQIVQSYRGHEQQEMGDTDEILHKFFEDDI